MREKFSIVQGEIHPSWETTLIGPDGVPLDLHGASVTLRFAPQDQSAVARSRACVIADPFVGAVRVDWAAGDTAIAGVYDARFTVTYPAGDTLSIPPGWPLQLAIAPAL